MAIRREKCMGRQVIGIYGGDHPWLKGTTYGAVDGPAGPSMAAIDCPAGPYMATKFAVVWGDHRWRDSPQFWGNALRNNITF